VNVAQRRLKDPAEPALLLHDDDVEEGSGAPPHEDRELNNVLNRDISMRNILKWGGAIALMLGACSLLLPTLLQRFQDAPPTFGVGILLSIASGLVNGTWNLPTKPDAPNLFRACRGQWAWENVWLVAQLLTPLVCSFTVLCFVPLSELAVIYSQTNTSALRAIVGFGLVWGIGGVGFGMAIKTAGIALGTALCMGIILTIGTLLPIFMGASRMSTAQIAGTGLGVIIGVDHLLTCQYLFSCTSKASKMNSKRLQGWLV
jgi:hypothetical protein